MKDALRKSAPAPLRLIRIRILNTLNQSVHQPFSAIVCRTNIYLAVLTEIHSVTQTRPENSADRDFFEFHPFNSSPANTRGRLSFVEPATATAIAGLTPLSTLPATFQRKA